MVPAPLPSAAPQADWSPFRPSLSKARDGVAPLRFPRGEPISQPSGAPRRSRFRVGSAAWQTARESRHDRGDATRTERGHED